MKTQPPVFETWPQMERRHQMEKRLAIRFQLEVEKVSRAEAARRLKMTLDALHGFCYRHKIDRRDHK